ncbi:MAG: ZIP family metal transporter [Lachnospiraceae bacterium]|nr:ZIP family metal transporter [Lachnospiraceae bacterium]
MEIKVLQGILLPFLGTSLGAGCVFFLRGEINRNLKRGMTGFAAGVMVSASVWSLLIPSMNHAEGMGKLAFFPAVVGFLLGMGFLLLLDTVTPHIHINQNTAEGPVSSLPRTAMLLFAVTLHNIPEGMAVGVVYAGWITGEVEITALAALALALGIALQNFPEGAIISMPLAGEGMKRGKAFGLGVASGVVEPVAAALTIIFSRQIVPVLPYLLSFAAGAMIYVVVEELILEMSEGEHSNLGTIAFAIGFSMMMILDVVLG